MGTSASVERLGAIAVVAKQLIVRRKVATKSVSPRLVLRRSVFGTTRDYVIQTEEGDFRYATTGTVAFDSVPSHYPLLDVTYFRQASRGGTWFAKVLPAEEVYSRHAL